MKTQKEYDVAMKRIDALMKKGEDNITSAEARELRKLAVAAQQYEKSIYTISAPTTIEGMVELRMYELKLNQSRLAKILGVTDAKLSQILNGKRSPDVAFLQALHRELNIDADFLLTHA
ncbi:MAG: helix-turn-helix transcriptional regulator [Bacteroidetes bacterium]|nr:helix-turn-helix transcriptional regulator [Bacteroidota bacterium]MBS1684927.1 helix-turn-helix transcriptional regulator [Bacteroidota bacterium]